MLNSTFRDSFRLMHGCVSGKLEGNETLFLYSFQVSDESVPVSMAKLCVISCSIGLVKSHLV